MWQGKGDMSALSTGNRGFKETSMSVCILIQPHIPMRELIHLSSEDMESWIDSSLQAPDLYSRIRRNWRKQTKNHVKQTSSTLLTFETTQGYETMLPADLSTCRHVNLSNRPHVYLTTCLAFYLSACLPVLLPTCLSVDRSTHLLVYLFTRLPVYPSTCRPVDLFTCRTVDLSTSLHVYLSTRLSTCIPV